MFIPLSLLSSKIYLTCNTFFYQLALYPINDLQGCQKHGSLQTVCSFSNVSYKCLDHRMKRNKTGQMSSFDRQKQGTCK